MNEANKQGSERTNEGATCRTNDHWDQKKRKHLSETVLSTVAANRVSSDRHTVDKLDKVVISSNQFLRGANNRGTNLPPSAPVIGVTMGSRY